MLHRETRGEWVSGRAAERQLKSKSKEGRERKREGTSGKTEKFPIRWNVARKFHELERAERKNFQAEPSTSENYKINFRAEPSLSGKSFEQLRARAKPSEHKSFFEHDLLFDFEQSRAEIER